MPLATDGNIDGDRSRRLWMALVGAPLAGYDTSRAAFLGGYRSYDRPLVVEQGQCTNSDVYGDNSCGTLQADLTLQPGETREILIMLGIGDATRDGLPAVTQFGSLESAAREFEHLKQNWHSKLVSLTVETPDLQFNSMMNVWAPYNALITFAWSRAASLTYNGERDGLGYRDSVQDVLGVTSSIPAESRQRLELMLTGQVSTGGAMPLIKPFAHCPGHEALSPAEDYRSDDCLWFFTRSRHMLRNRRRGFYNQVLPYAD
jgi:cellobiose phosphorylase